MNEEDGLQALSIQLGSEVEDAWFIGVGGEVVHHHNFGLQLVRLAEDLYLFSLLHDSAPQRVLGLIAHDHHRVFRILHVVAQVMQDAFGEGWVEGGKASIKLTNVLWVDETVSTFAKIREEVAEGSQTRVHCDVWVDKGDETRVLLGTASAVV